MLEKKDQNQTNKFNDLPAETKYLYTSISKIFQNSLFILTPDLSVILANGPAIFEFGFLNQEEIINKSLLELVAISEKNNTKDSIKKAINNYKIKNFKSALVKSNGEIFPGEINVTLANNQESSAKHIIVTVRDVSKQKETERQLTNSQARFKMIVDYANDWEVFRDKNAELVYVSPAFGRITGYSVDDYISDKITYEDLFFPDDLQKSREHLAKLFRRESFNDVEFRIIKKNGDLIFVSISGQPVIDESGEFCGTRISTRDITKRKQAQDEVRQSAKKFREFYDRSRDGYVRYKLDGTFIECNSSYRKMLGYTIEEFMRINQKYLTPRGWHEWEEKEVIGKQILQRGYSDIYEKEYIRKNGSVFPVELQLYLIKDDKGDPVEVWGVIRDISLRKDSERALRFTQFSVDNSAEAAFWMTSDGNLIYVNAAACNSLGYSTQELQSKSVYDINPNFSKKVWANYWNEIKERGLLKLVSTHRKKNGEMFPIEIVANFLEFEGREYSCAFVQDISIRNKAREEIEVFHKFADLSGQGFGMADLKGRIVYANSALSCFLGEVQEDVIGKFVFEYYSKKELDFLKKKILPEVLKRGQWTGEINLCSRNKEERPTIQNLFLIKNDKGEPAFFANVLTDITQQKRSEKEKEKLNKDLAQTNKKLQRLALIDCHTGLYNFRYLEDSLEREFQRAKRHDLPLSLMMIDLDYFKSFNDVYGHQFGDLLLRQVSRLIKKTVRRYDVPVRFGGEEFIVISPGIDRAAVASLAQRVLDAVNTRDFGNRKNSVKLKMSIGVASYPEDKAAKSSGLLTVVDKILAKAKEDGGDRVYSSLDMYQKKYSGLKARRDITNTTHFLKGKIDKLTKRANQSLIEAVYAFAKTIKLKDHYTGKHVESTVCHAAEIAKKLNCSKKNIENIKQAAMLHDLGKIGISDKVLLKKSSLTKSEYEQMKRHPEIGVGIIRPIHFLHDIIPYILYHHEKWDGSGYPSGISGEEIPIGARIISVADVFHALVSDRSYRPAYSEEEAIQMIKDGSGTQFDPQIVEAFLQVTSCRS